MKSKSNKKKNNTKKKNNKNNKKGKQRARGNFRMVKVPKLLTLGYKKTKRPAYPGLNLIKNLEIAPIYRQGEANNLNDSNVMLSVPDLGENRAYVNLPEYLLNVEKSEQNKQVEKGFFEKLGLTRKNIFEKVRKYSPYIAAAMAVPAYMGIKGINKYLESASSNGNAPDYSDSLQHYFGFKNPRRLGMTYAYPKGLQLYTGNK